MFGNQYFVVHKKKSIPNTEQHGIQFNTKLYYTFLPNKYYNLTIYLHEADDEKKEQKKNKMIR